MDSATSVAPSDRPATHGDKQAWCTQDGPHLICLMSMWHDSSAAFGQSFSFFSINISSFCTFHRFFSFRTNESSTSTSFGDISPNTCRRHTGESKTVMSCDASTSDTRYGLQRQSIFYQAIFSAKLRSETTYERWIRFHENTESVFKIRKPDTNYDHTTLSTICSENQDPAFNRLRNYKSEALGSEEPWRAAHLPQLHERLHQLLVAPPARDLSLHALHELPSRHIRPLVLPPVVLCEGHRHTRTSYVVILHIIAPCREYNQRIMP